MLAHRLCVQFLLSLPSSSLPCICFAFLWSSSRLWSSRELSPSFRTISDSHDRLHHCGSELSSSLADSYLQGGFCVKRAVARSHFLRSFSRSSWRVYSLSWLLRFLSWSDSTEPFVSTHSPDLSEVSAIASVRASISSRSRCAHMSCISS